VIVTLAYLGMIGCVTHRSDSPLGMVHASWQESGELTVENVPSFRSAANVCVPVNGYRRVRGDVKWGGNWFFLVNDSPVDRVARQLGGTLKLHACDTRSAGGRRIHEGPFMLS
jgi:proline racemase